MIINLVQVGSDPGLPKQDRIMLAYAIKLTQTPGKMALRDVELLKEVGFDDMAIHDICSVAAYFNFVNRTADGLGVELESRFNTK